MKEVLELRINYEFYNLLFTANEGRNLGNSVKIIQLTKEDPRYFKVPSINMEVKRNFNRSFLLGWELKRKYKKVEIDNAELFQMKINTTFEPAGEECGTIYSEENACEICGANRRQLNKLHLKKGSIPNKDISKTIAGEVVVSDRFVAAFKKRNLKGGIIEPVVLDKGISSYFQLRTEQEIILSSKTVAGIDPFNLSESAEAVEFSLPGGYEVKFEKEIYKCPNGHTIGLNLLSELYLLYSPTIYEIDFFSTKQKVGVKRGFLRPEPLYLCSPEFRKMIVDEKLTGFDFEIANVLS